MTYYHKRIFPLFWFGFLGLFILVGIYSETLKGKISPVPLFIIPIIMAVFGYFLFKKIIFDLVDEVYDGGDFLLIKNKQREDRIKFSNIRNVSYTTFMNPQRITISLRESSAFGKEVSFSPQLRLTLNFFQKDPLIEDLINRVENARIR
jgi:hypothetical protein